MLGIFILLVFLFGHGHQAHTSFVVLTYSVEPDVFTGLFEGRRIREVHLQVLSVASNVLMPVCKQYPNAVAYV